ncbi:nascent polypeptide-associated complex subunit alpha, muscle-specific form-like [Hyposmocoma kahamanoa]|uniref:nascent polypeptide-associated complex subunit alpha, muscle-specific form-like n=1 Tax=Hyposmocoma kahamanoa TaxID=1477025 RepID=UPI000E6D778B|nr:nascent polypeptide-associated complex subunit alpha, muscle-specific form-like [Hyposmocoma kahamanoa]
MDLNDHLLNTNTQNPKPAVLEGKPKSAPQATTNTQRPTVSGRPKGKPQGQPSTDAGASTTPAVVAQTPGSAAPAQNPSNAALEAGWTLVSRKPKSKATAPIRKEGTSGHGERPPPAPSGSKRRPARKNKKARRRERERRTSHNPLPKEGEARPPVGGASGPGTASARSNGSVAHPTGRPPPLLTANRERAGRGPRPLPNVPALTRPYLLEASTSGKRLRGPLSNAPTPRPPGPNSWL